MGEDSHFDRFVLNWVGSTTNLALYGSFVAPFFFGCQELPVKEQDPAVRHGTAPNVVQGAELFENFLGKDFGTKQGEKRHEVFLFFGWK